MEVFGFTLLDGVPAVYHEGLDILAVSDLHLGLEGTATLDGNYVPPVQLDQALEASRLLVNGDIKNQFSGTRFTESSELEDFFEFATNAFDEVILVRGNHDNFVEEILGRYGLELQPFFKEDGVLFVHGHKKVEEMDVGDYETLVVGHEHPALAIKDEVGVREKIRVLLHGETRDGENLVVLPAFAEAASGTEVNETPVSQLLCPVLRDRTDVSRLKAVAMERDAETLEFPRLGRLS
jgi:hypothetical protein